MSFLSWKAMQELRQSMRARRRQLTDDQREVAAKQLFSQFSCLPFVRECQHIAVYAPFDGEIDPKYIVNDLWRQNKNVYLPVLQQTKVMQFAHYEQTSTLQLNHFNILEPKAHGYILINDFDLILVPLVAFDNHGNRLGMGAGYYDATLQNVTSKPRLIGLAYEFQRIDRLMVKSSDVKLHGILTNAHYYEILVT